MAQYTITIEDKNLVDGITFARERRNADNTETQDFVPLTTNEEYVQFVMEKAAESYANAKADFEG